tara:strand:- start:18 stop:158 length:141 start_codon:yes stop_codon:yes gene_type:complete
MYSIVENPIPESGIEPLPTFQVFKDGEVVFYATTKTECEAWIAQQG